MERQIKFRAFDKLHNEMVAVDEIDFDESGDICEVNTSTYCWNRSGKAPANLDSIVLMQFIGIQDKTGRDVYEDDVVRCSMGCLHFVEWRQEMGGEFGGGMPGHNLSAMTCGYGKGYAWCSTEEVVGNIHEHPALLEQIESEFSKSSGEAGLSSEKVEPASPTA